jgi:hypothetical protein
LTILVVLAIPLAAFLAGYLRGRRQDPSWSTYDPFKVQPDRDPKAWDVI